ncbi:MAG: transcriptional regulator [Phenylobacterium zucineum]|nr:MAG: transcriptional regulator [Phenylobacterium zucineum]
MAAMSLSTEVDGRRRRGQDNRARIVAAMLEIIREGVMIPGAEQVAARAEVGLRTVFRHFDDMDSLYREMTVAIETELRALMGRPFLAEGWRDRLVELVTRRSEVFERIMPFRRASDTVRHRSRFLAEDHARLATTLRELLKGVLPDELVTGPTKFEALDLLTGFEAWSRLRVEQGLSPDEARRVLQLAVVRLATSD